MAPHRTSSISTTWIGDANNQQLAEHICNHLHSGLTDDMAVDQVDGGREEAGAGAGRFHPDLLVLTVQKVIGAVANELGQGVSWRRRSQTDSPSSSLYSTTVNKIMQNLIWK